jgi:hypothetical protein
MQDAAPASPGFTWAISCYTLIVRQPGAGARVVMVSITGKTW